MNRRDFMGNAALAGLLPLIGTGAAAAGGQAGATRAPGRLLPMPLNPGDTIGLVSPSAATDERISLQLAREAMQALGFKVKSGEHLGSRYGHLAGTDAQRAGDLNAMFADDEVRAVICIRAGTAADADHGAARLLPLLDYAAIRAVDEAAAGAEVALVFGRERTGLDNEELQLCHAAVHIPANPDYSSLNLAAAVQVLAYELRLALLAVDGAVPVPEQPVSQASHAQLEGMFAQLGETLDAIDFHKGRAPESAMRKLRRLFLRADLDEREVRLLRGILSDAQRMAMLAGRR